MLDVLVAQLTMLAGSEKQEQQEDEAIEEEEDRSIDSHGGADSDFESEDDMGG